MRLVNAFFLLWLVLFPISPAFAVLIGSKIGFDDATNFSIIAQHGPILVTHPDMLNDVSPSKFWEYKIQFDNTEKPGILDPNDTVKIEGTITHKKSPPPPFHRDGVGTPVPFSLFLNANSHDKFGIVTRKDADNRKHGTKGHYDLLKATATANVLSPPSPIPGVDSATDDITAYNLEVKVIHTVSKPAVTNGIGGPRAGKKDSPNLTFDSNTGTLSFSNTIIDFVNLVGDTSLDHSFSNDPIFGATISVTDFTLSGLRGNGFLFTGGMLSVTNSNQAILQGEIPELLINDDVIAEFSSNIFGPILISEIDVSASPFMDAYTDFLFANPGRPAELFGQTSFPVTDLIRNGQSFTTAIQDFSFSTSVPEPPTLALLLACFFGLAFAQRRNNLR